MVEEISNKTLAILLIAAIAISLGGTLLSLNRLATVMKIPTITGFATDTKAGTTNVTIATTASLRFSVANLDFGAGAVNTTAGNTLCSMASAHGTGGYKDSNAKCINFSTATTLNSLELENDGNTNFTLNISFDQLAAAFIGGGVSGTETLLFKVTNNDTGSCEQPEPTNWSTVNSTNQMKMCQNATGMGYADTKDSMDIHINITIPYDSLRIGTNNVLTVTVYGTTI